MMRGYIDDQLVPRVDDAFIVGRDGLIPLDTVMDTGFNDEFCLPRKYFQKCDL